MGFEDGLGRWEAHQADGRWGRRGAAGLDAQGQGLRPSRKPPLCPGELGPSLLDYQGCWSSPESTNSDVPLLMERGQRGPAARPGHGAGLWLWQGCGRHPRCPTSAAGPRRPHLGPGPQEPPLRGQTPQQVVPPHEGGPRGPPCRAPSGLQREQWFTPQRGGAPGCATRGTPLAGLRKGFLESSIEAELRMMRESKRDPRGGELGACSRPRLCCVLAGTRLPF